MRLDHEAIYKAYPNVTTIHSVNGTLDSDGNKVTVEQSKIDEARTELNKLKYKKDRRNEYPDFGEQLDMIYHDIDAWKAKIKSIKDKYPKEGS